MRIDPLFLTADYRWYDLDAERAKALDPMRIDVKDRDTRAVVGHINVRFSYMSPRFGSIDKSKDAVGKNANERFPILKEYNGFIISRMGRIIEDRAALAARDVRELRSLHQDRDRLRRFA
jgi:hypothetical protein